MCCSGGTETGNKGKKRHEITITVTSAKNTEKKKRKRREVKRQKIRRMRRNWWVYIQQFSSLGGYLTSYLLQVKRVASCLTAVLILILFVVTERRKREMKKAG